MRWLYNDTGEQARVAEIDFGVEIDFCRLSPAFLKHKHILWMAKNVE